jgi:hypothetical protein
MHILRMEVRVLVHWVIRTACRISTNTSNNNNNTSNTNTNTNTNIILSIKVDLRQVNHKAQGNLHRISCITFIIRSRRTSFIPGRAGISEDRAKAENLGGMRDDESLVETCFESAE